MVVRCGVLETGQHGGNVMRHGNVHIVVGVVPLDGQAAEEAAVPIFGDRIQVA